jgi:aldose 1-epimerase
MLLATSQVFGTLPNGRTVREHMLTSDSVELHAIDYGCAITGLWVPDRNRLWRNTVLGSADIAPYVINKPYLGAVIGRYANRIANGMFELDGQPYRVTTNASGHHLHGGTMGFHRRLWQGSLEKSRDRVAVTFRRVSPAGEEGFPGDVDVRVRYALTSADEIILNYEAQATAPTPFNITQHTYFNLSGLLGLSARDHELTIAADRFVSVRPDLIPTGSLAAVNGTPFDFRDPRLVGEALEREHPQLSAAGGFDHTWVLNQPNGEATNVVLRDPHSGRELRITTTEPGVQFYDGHLLYGNRASGFARYTGLCLETQHFPDSPNQPTFPTTILRPGNRYWSTTTWRFSAR